MTSKVKPLMTVADLDALPDDNNRYELIAGELFVSTAPGIPHQRILLNLQLILGPYLRTNPIGILVPGAGLILSNFDAVIPDLAFVRRERWDAVTTGERFTGAPDLVIEIASPGSQNRARDFVAKRQLYGKYVINEYWIIDPQKRAIVVYANDKGTLKEVAKLDETQVLTTSLFPNLRLEVNEVFQLD
jgi:Uma2 family endonuclease